VRLDVVHPLGWIFKTVDAGFDYSERTKVKSAVVEFAYLNGNGCSTSNVPTCPRYNNTQYAPIDPAVLYAPTSLSYSGVPRAMNYNVLNALSRQFYLVQNMGTNDYNRNYSPRDVQLQVFERQLQIAVDLQMPLFLHQRDAHADFVALLGRYRDKVPGAVVHCFTDTGEALRDYLALDCHIGITGWICDERRGRPLRDCVGLIPPDKLMLETDAPYLLPRDLEPRPKSRRNEPCYLPHVARAVAQLRGATAENLAAATTRNAVKFFGLKEVEAPGAGSQAPIDW